MTALLQRDVPQNFPQASKARACAARSGADEDVRCFGGGSGRGISQADSTTRERCFTFALTFHSTSKPWRGMSRIPCTAIGDTVNLASCIEQLTKIYSARFLV
jgi:hypothetical protein